MDQDNNLNRVCRFCLNNARKLFFDAKYSNLHYLAEIMTGLDLKKDEFLPTKICSNCIKRFELIYEFHLLCLKSNEHFLNFQKKTAVESEFKPMNTEDEDTLLKFKPLEEIYESISDTLQTESIYLTESTDSFFKIENHVRIDDKAKEDSEELKCTEIEVLAADDSDCTHIKKKESKNMETEMLAADDLNCMNIKKKGSAYSHRIGEFVCELCGNKYKTYEYLNIHKNVKHNPNFKKLKCDICGKEFDFKQSLKSHKAYHGAPSCECEICKKKLHTRNELRKHMMIHKNIWNYKCEICSKSFRTSSHRAVHMRGVHSKVKPFHCDIGDCIKSFAENYLLNFHKKKYHKNEI